MHACCIELSANADVRKKQVEFNKANPSRTFFVADMPPPPGVSGLSETLSEAKGAYDQSQKDSLDLKEATVLTDEDQRTADVG